MRTEILTFILSLALAIPAISQDTPEPVEVAKLATYTENPVFDKKGNLYVSEPHQGPITRITSSGEISVWTELGNPTGHKILEDGTHLVCDVNRKVILKFDPYGNEIGEVITECSGRLLGIPNDLALDEYGGFYFTDSKVLNDSIGIVGYVDGNGQSLLVAELDGFPNGIALSADGKVLHVALSGKNQILSYLVISPGKVGKQEVFAKLPEREDGEWSGPDGIAFDKAGNLYVAHYEMGQIQVLSPKGKLIKSLPAGQRRVTNITFGGPEGDQLYITGCPNELQKSGYVYKLDLSKLNYETSRK
ncbi:SMP-30/gluconolactonase/LRE family protein [Catalinimonas sp. 4WD22]|uniref:SMP-30/gluconolactonase/LRE family protein n=1 Tax=Catalinimonas locisalis TaxID=3133978 RepID=UPI003100F51A